MDVTFALYDAFTPEAFGGSQAVIVENAAGIPAETRARLAKELGYPATCYVDAVTGTTVKAQFFSTVMELPMCGHGTMALVTHLVEQEAFGWKGEGKIEILLDLPQEKATVEVAMAGSNRPGVMLKITPSSFRTDRFNANDLAKVLGLTEGDFVSGLPLETAVGDFIHLVVPVDGLDAMKRLTPDFSGIVDFCHANKVQTVVAFSTETESPEKTVHVRDFCPAVGVPESAAAGTTNAALTCYLIRNGLVSADAAGRVEVLAEQGMEINRPSSITSVALLNGQAISSLHVGGVATRVAQGSLFVPVEGPIRERKAG